MIGLPAQRVRAAFDQYRNKGGKDFFKNFTYAHLMELAQDITYLQQHDYSTYNTKHVKFLQEEIVREWWNRVEELIAVLIMALVK